MSALITSVDHALAIAASDTVKVATFMEVKALPALKQAQVEAAEESQWRSGHGGRSSGAKGKQGPSTAKLPRQSAE